MTSNFLDKEALLSQTVETKDIEIAGLGVIKVKALTRSQALTCAEISDIPKREKKMLLFSLVEPSLNREEIMVWCNNSPAGQIGGITEQIAELSGMLDDSLKEEIKNFRE